MSEPIAEYAPAWVPDNYRWFTDDLRDWARETFNYPPSSDASGTVPKAEQNDCSGANSHNQKGTN